MRLRLLAEITLDMIALRKELKRKTVAPFIHYKKSVIVELVPGDVIRLRLFGQRVGSAVSIKIQDLYFELMRRKVAALKAEKKRNKKRRK
jgi:hypothetical protein